MRERLIFGLLQIAACDLVTVMGWQARGSATEINSTALASLPTLELCCENAIRSLQHHIAQIEGSKRADSSQSSDSIRTVSAQVLPRCGGYVQRSVR